MGKHSIVPPHSTTVLLSTDRHPQGKFACKVIIDTGADITLVPARVISELEILDPNLHYDFADVIGFGSEGKKKTVKAYYLNVQIDQTMVVALRVLCDDVEVGFLGRDFLSKVTICFDQSSQWCLVDDYSCTST